MAEYSGFFPSINGDRKYYNEDLARKIAKLVTNGVYNNSLATKISIAGNSVNVESGWAIINGYDYENDGIINFNIPYADGVLNRIDTVVLRLDIPNRYIKMFYIKGVLSSNPVPIPPQRDNNIYELVLSQIKVRAGASKITQSDITSTILNTALCGIVTGVITQVDTTTLYNQIQSDLAEFKSVEQTEFMAWFETIKGILDDETAGNLLKLIGEQNNKRNTFHATATKSSGYYNLDIHDKPDRLPEHYSVTFTLPDDYAVGDKVRINGVEHLVNLYEKYDNTSLWTGGAVSDKSKINHTEGYITGYSVLNNWGGFQYNALAKNVIKPNTDYTSITDLKSISAPAITTIQHNLIQLDWAVAATPNIPTAGYYKQLCRSKPTILDTNVIIRGTYGASIIAINNTFTARFMLLEGDYSVKELPADYWEDTYGEYEIKTNTGRAPTTGEIPRGRTITLNISSSSNAVVNECELVQNRILTLNLAYPVGSVKITNTSANPSASIGGTWILDSVGRAIVGVDTAQSEFNTVGKTGGAKTHTLTMAELPAYTYASGSNGWMAEQVPPAAGNKYWMYNSDYTKSGSGQAHNNLQPYQTFYIWRRTA